MVQLQWTVHYDIAALVFIAILLLFIFQSRYIRVAQNRLFVWLAFTMLTATAIDLISAFTLSYAAVVPLWLNNALNMLCLLFSQILPALLLFYLFMVLHVYNAHNRKRLWLFCLPFLPAAAIILSSPATGLAFYFDEELHYVHGPLWGALFLPAVYVILVSLIYIIRYRSRVSLVQRLSMLSFNLFAGAAVLLQAVFFEWVLLTYFAMSLSLFIMFLALQRQEYYIHKLSDTFNAEAFLDVYEERMRVGKDFGIAIVEIAEVQLIQSIYGQSLTAALQKHVKETLNERFGCGEVFMLSITRYAAFYVNPLGNKLEQCIEEIRAGWVVDDKRYKLPCSAATFSNRMHMPSAENIFAFLDIAALTLKEEPRDGIIDMGEEAYVRLNRRMAVQRALHRAIENGTLNVYYQPIYDAGTHRVCLVEALARIEDDELGVIPAYEFIDIAERDGSIVNMTLRLFERACVTSQRLAEGGFRLQHICFNLSAIQLLQNHLAEELLAIAQAHQVSLSQFSFELTETEPITRSGQVGDNISKLCENGARLSLDDFGTGYSNFSNILEISFDTVKLDKSLVTGYIQGRGGYLKHLCELFHEFDIKVIAEGVESLSQADQLLSLGCDMLQGYYFCRPVSENGLLQILSEPEK